MTINLGAANRMLHLCLLLGILSVVYPSLVNRTIDDTFGDSITGVVPTYEGADWHACYINSGCQLGAAFPNPNYSQFFHETFHVSFTADTEVMTIKFNGIAIYVYFAIIVASERSPLTITGSIDGTPAGQPFSPNQTSLNVEYIYNFPVFSAEGLPSGDHQLDLIVSNAVALFDYAIYVQEISDAVSSTNSKASNTVSTSPADTTPIAHSHSKIPAIAGGTVGGVIAIGIVLIALFLWRRGERKRGSADTGDFLHKPFGEQMTSTSDRPISNTAAGIEDSTNRQEVKNNGSSEYAFVTNITGDHVLESPTSTDGRKIADAEHRLRSTEFDPYIASSSSSTYISSSNQHLEWSRLRDENAHLREQLDSMAIPSNSQQSSEAMRNENARLQAQLQALSNHQDDRPLSEVLQEVARLTAQVQALEGRMSGGGEMPPTYSAE